MYLIDTNVISEARKKDKADSGVRRFFARMEAEELNSGIAFSAQ